MRQIFYIAFYVACGAGRYIDQQSGRGLYLRHPVILCINFAFYNSSSTKWYKNLVESSSRESADSSGNSSWMDRGWAYGTSTHEIQK